MNRYIAEFLGTFALIFAGTGAIIVNDLNDGVVSHVGVALTFGVVVMVMVFTIGDISGAHINPAVTLGCVLEKRLPARDAMPYIIAQCAGAIAASLILKALFSSHETLGASAPAGDWWPSLILEVILTMFLVLVILSVTSGVREKAITAGLAIGGVITFGGLFAGPVSGGSFNPARSLGPAIVAGELGSLWLYLVGPLVGGALASACWRVIRPQPSPAQ